MYRSIEHSASNIQRGLPLVVVAALVVFLGFLAGKAADTHDSSNGDSTAAASAAGRTEVTAGVHIHREAMAMP